MNDDRQMLSIYRKDFRLLMCLVADDTESARNWQSAFGKVMKTSAKNYIPIYQTQEGNGALEKDEEVSSNSGVGEFRVSDELNEKLKLHKKLVWRTLGVTDGVRVMHEVKLTKLYLCLRVSCVMRGSPKEVLDMIQYHELEWDENLQSVEVIEEVGPNCRIEHVKRHPEVFGPFTASPRDSVLKRFLFYSSIYLLLAIEGFGVNWTTEFMRYPSNLPIMKRLQFRKSMFVKRYL